VYRAHILGHVVRELRRLGAAGASARDILGFLQARLPDSELMRCEYLEAAFLQRGGSFTYLLLPNPSTGESLSEAVIEKGFAERVRQHRARWAAEPFPELMRLRDYHSFLELAKETDFVLVVCGANPYAGGFIGRAGYRCFDQRRFVVSRETGPNEGLIAADPQDARLVGGLRAYAQPLAYDRYVAELASGGYRVLGPDEGYVIEDHAGARFYEGYRLHSAYHASSGETAWTSRDGESLRARINARLGGELVRFGPQDDWASRNDRAAGGPLSGPQAPLIAFRPNGEIESYFHFDEMARSRSGERSWSQIYTRNLSDLPSERNA
jgi:hypothetical protein